jgi:hypothetical protein
MLGLVSSGRSDGQPLLYAVAAGLLSSVVPYAADLTALRFVPARFFGVFMSSHPVLAALAGLLLLGQVLALHGVDRDRRGRRRERDGRRHVSSVGLPRRHRGRRPTPGAPLPELARV